MKNTLKIEWHNNNANVPHYIGVEDGFDLTNEFTTYLEELFCEKVKSINFFEPNSKYLTLLYKPIIVGGTPRKSLVLALTTKPVKVIEGITTIIRSFPLTNENEFVFDQIRFEYYGFLSAEYDDELLFEEFNEDHIGAILSIIGLVVSVIKEFENQLSWSDSKGFKLQRLDDFSSN